PPPGHCRRYQFPLQRRCQLRDRTDALRDRRPVTQTRIKMSRTMSLTTVKSAHGVPETVDRVIAALSLRGIRIFARIDHAAGARQAGLELADEELVIFGDPRAGTLLMHADAAVGYDHPLRLLIWDARGYSMIGSLPTT